MQRKVKQMKDWVITYWLEIAFGLLTTLCGFGYRKLIKKINEQEAIKKGLQALLRDRIIQTYNHYMDKEYFPIYARENLDGLSREYYNLGGNGVVPKLVAKLLELPTCHERGDRNVGECDL